MSRKTKLNTVQGYLSVFFWKISYHIVASSSMSWLVAHFQTFRRLMKGKFDAYLCTVTFGQKVPKLNSRPEEAGDAHHITIYLQS